MIINSLVKLDIGIIVPERECLALARHLCSKKQSGDISSQPSFPPSMGSTLYAQTVVFVMFMWADFHEYMYVICIYM